MTRPREKSRRKQESNPGSPALEADSLTTRSTRRYLVEREVPLRPRYQSWTAAGVDCSFALDILTWYMGLLVGCLTSSTMPLYLSLLAVYLMSSTMLLYLSLSAVYLTSSTMLLYISLSAVYLTSSTMPLYLSLSLST